MISDLQNQSLAEKLRERAGAFVNSHVDLWVAVEDDGTLVLAGNSPADVFQSAADWLKDGVAYTVAAASWHHQAGEPAYTLRLILRHPEDAGTPAVPTQLP